MQESSWDGGVHDHDRPRQARSSSKERNAGWFVIPEAERAPALSIEESRYKVFKQPAYGRLASAMLLVARGMARDLLAPALAVIRQAVVSRP
jgi:hypothetical protein